jgi:peptidoglycan/xylan/chitin deacetylase (PgdA/CDA1 family)
MTHLDRQLFFRPYRSFASLARVSQGMLAARNRLPVLLYHSVCPNHAVANADHFNVRPETFEKQMAWLSQNQYTTISPDELLILMEDRGSWQKKKPVMIAFDDGYANAIRYALPILAKHGFKATFFLASSFLGKEEAFPWIQSPDGAALDEYRPMSSQQAVELAKTEDIRIGSHTKSHQSLTSLSADDAVDELREGKSDLESLLGLKVDHFAYPYGSKQDFNASHMEMCREAGFKTAFSTVPTSIRRPCSPYAIPRLTIYERDDPKNFELKVRGLFDSYDLYRRLYLFPLRLLNKILGR